MTKNEALKLALEALSDFDYEKRMTAITAIKEALAEQPAQQQEPVAFEAREIGEGDWFRVSLKDVNRIAGIIESAHMDYRWTYATTPQRKPLTDDRLEEMWDADTTSVDDCKSLYYFKVVARTIEAAHGIKE